RKWIEMFTRWIPSHPLIGHGAIGVGLVDTQIPRIVGESGLIGFAFWVSVMAGLFRRARTVFHRAAEPLAQGIAFGFLCGYVGLLIQSTGVNSFIVIRIMEPFWLIAAIVMRLYVQTTPPAEAPSENRPPAVELRRAYT